MARLLPTWVVVWLQVSTLVVTWDLTYVLLRPHSMAGGIYSHFYQPYEKYITIDKMYGHMDEDGTRYFIEAQSLLNIVEGFFAQVAVILFVLKISQAEIVAYSVSIASAAKTILYMAIDHVSGNRFTRHNEFFDLFFLYILPNCLWIVFPLLIVFTLGRQMSARLYPAATAAAAKSSVKKSQ
eukprot:m.53710 g.53710  ORF g.53710 m.53710 type:complete len:182 (-) comp13189_c0_seq2:167-712(-)